MFMKITHRYNLGFPISINAKCGESLGAFISGMFGLGSTLATNDTNEVIAEKQIEMQKEENKKNRDYNTAEAEKTRQFAAGQADIQRQYNTQERLAQQQYQTDQWNQQFERSNRDAYALQVEGARDSGLNPQVLFGNGTSAVGTSSVGAPTGSGGTTAASGPMASYNNGLSPVPFQAISPALAFQQIAQGVSSLASAKKSGADVDKIYQEIDNLQIEAKYKQILTKGLKLTNDLAKVKLKYSEKREIQELAKLVADTVLSNASGKVATNQAALFKAEEKVQNILADKTGQEFELLKLDYATYMQRFNGLSQLQAAETRLANESALTMKELRGWQVGFQQALTEIKQTESFVQRNTLWEQCEAKLAELRAAKMLPEQVEQALREARKRNDWFEVNQILGIVDTGVRAAGTYYGAKTGQGFVDAQNVSNSIKREYNAFEKQKYDDSRREKIRQVTGSGHYWGQDY